MGQAIGPGGELRSPNGRVRSRRRGGGITQRCPPHCRLEGRQTGGARPYARGLDLANCGQLPLAVVVAGKGEVGNRAKLFRHLRQIGHFPEHGDRRWLVDRWYFILLVGSNWQISHILSSGAQPGWSPARSIGGRHSPAAPQGARRVPPVRHVHPRYRGARKTLKPKGLRWQGHDSLRGARAVAGTSGKPRGM